MKNLRTKLTGAVLVLLTLGACSENEVKEIPLPQYSVAQPELKDIEYVYEYPGFLQSELVVELISRVEGYLIHVGAKPGQKVQQGDTLFVIEPRNYQDKVAEAQAQLSTAQANLSLAVTTLDRIKEAAKSNAVSELEVFQAENQLELSKAAVQSAQAQLSTAQTNLNYCYIRAISSGRVTKNLVDLGNYIRPNTKLGTFYKNDKMFVYFSVEANKLIWAQKQAMQPGSGIERRPQISRVDVKVADAQGGVEYFPGKIDYLAPTANMTTGTVDMRAVIDNKQAALNNGVYVKVSFPYKKVKNAVLIPESSIGTDQIGRYIYVVENDTVRYRTVQVGQLQRDNTREILQGLTADEYYISKALTRVRNGQAIQPMLDGNPITTKAVADSTAAEVQASVEQPKGE